MATKTAVKTSNKNNPNERNEATVMLFRDKKVKGVKIVGLECTLPDGTTIARKPFIAIADAGTEELLLDEEGMPYEIKNAHPKE